MTRVTDTLRLRLHEKIMAGLPAIDHRPAILALVQEVATRCAPEPVRAMLGNPDLRGYLHHNYLTVRVGNRTIVDYGDHDHENGIAGLPYSDRRLTIQLHDPVSRLPEGSFYREVIDALTKSGLATAHIEQVDLRKNVSQRLRENLNACRTFKQLYTVLEPELHHFIPKDEARANLPARVAPVVDDLRKLGAVLPDTPKAEVTA